MQKTADAYKLWHNTLPNLRRSTRYSLGEKISLLFIELMELILAAGFAVKENKAIIIKKASLKLDLLKFFMQIAWELRAIDNRKFAELAEPLVEVGKMLGGWQKQLIKETPPYRRRSEKILAGTDEPIVAVEVVVEIVEVEYPQLAIPVEVSHVAVTVVVKQNYEKYRLNHRPSNTLGVVFYSEPSKLANIFHRVSSFSNLLKHSTESFSRRYSDFQQSEMRLPEAVTADINLICLHYIKKLKYKKIRTQTEV